MIVTCPENTYFFFGLYTDRLPVVTLTCNDGRWGLEEPDPSNVETHRWETRLNGCYERAKCYLEYPLMSPVQVWPATAEAQVNRSGEVINLAEGAHLEPGDMLVLKGDENDQVSLTCARSHQLFWHLDGVSSSYTFTCQSTGSWSAGRARCYPVFCLFSILFALELFSYV
ncbi:uncharacterized protein LOC126980624 [Eriocheir sinensis]|uniref:uncharacterized protein LOC126980624 n=1 Tax=Eriocheir sinensis TaxID=95602 RepID=UPI0021C694C4|nr:uncharacterized protein LOC126980624 [Eriocheir sinensis]